jgi:Flp pilus assembly protein TadD
LLFWIDRINNLLDKQVPPSYPAPADKKVRTEQKASPAGTCRVFRCRLMFSHRSRLWKFYSKGFNHPRKVKMPSPVSTSSDRFLSEKLGKYLPLCLLIIFITLLVYGQVWKYDFLIWDDPLYVTANFYIQTGFHWDSIRWAFTTNHGATWLPLTWLSYMLDYQLYGLSPGGYHLTNLFWHLLNCLLLFRILQSMTRENWPSFFVAILFAIHPLRVESVAWVTERKDVLSAFFWLLTTWLYLRYVRVPVLKNFIPVIVSMGLGLMAKPMLVTLPFALLLLDFWPLRRVQAYRSWISLLKEKIPLFVLALISAALTIWAQTSVITMFPWDSKPLPLRIENAVISYVGYLYKIFWPVGLSAFYPYPDSGFPLWKLGLASITLGGLTWLAWRSRRRFPYVLIGWLWFVGTLVPVIGIVQVAGHALADRFTYIPSIGIFIIIAWGIRDSISLRPPYRWGLVLACTSAVIVLSALCHIQVQHWRNSITLFQHALSVQEDNSLAHACLGAAFLQQGNPELAEKHLTRALEINPNYPEALNDLGMILLDKGMYREAVTRFSQALTLHPNYAEAHNNLGLTLTRVNRFPEAIEHYKIAIALDPMFPKAINNLGAALAQQGRLEDAKPYFLQALTIQPSYNDVYNNLGLLYYQQQDYANSRTYFESGLSYNSNNPKAYFFLGLIAAAQGQDREAADYFSHALKLDPNFQEAAENLRSISGKYQRN